MSRVLRFWPSVFGYFSSIGLSWLLLSSKATSFPGYEASFLLGVFTLFLAPVLVFFQVCNNYGFRLGLEWALVCLDKTLVLV